MGTILKEDVGQRKKPSPSIVLESCRSRSNHACEWHNSEDKRENVLGIAPIPLFQAPLSLAVRYVSSFSETETKFQRKKNLISNCTYKKKWNYYIVEY